jgi:hypothetical protein
MSKRLRITFGFVAVTAAINGAGCGATEPGADASPQIVPKIPQNTACSRTIRSNAVISGTNHSRRMFGMA